MSAAGFAKLGAGLFQRAARIVAVGAMFSAFSEFWFYRLTDDVGQIGLILAYGVFGYVFLLTLRLFQVRSFAGLFLAASVFGFLVEGSVVPVLYMTLPFSIAWTSLGWHALFTVSIGFFLYRRVMSAPSPGGAIVLNAVLGIALGIWNAYLWNVIEDAGTIRFEWHATGEFALQFLIGWVFFVGGHLLLDRFPPDPRPPGRPEFAFFLSLALVPYVLAFMIQLFPYSMVLPVLLAVSLVSLRAGARNSDNPWLENLFARTIPGRRYALSLLVPVLAIGTYQAMAWARLEWETNVAVAGLAVPISALYWIYALVRSPRAGRQG